MWLCKHAIKRSFEDRPHVDNIVISHGARDPAISVTTDPTPDVSPIISTDFFPYWARTTLASGQYKNDVDVAFTPAGVMLIVCVEHPDDNKAMIAKKYIFLKLISASLSGYFIKLQQVETRHPLLHRFFQGRKQPPQ